MNNDKRKMEIVFVKEYKSFIFVFDKKSKEDYVLNVSKIIKDKFNTKFMIPNKVQSFILNYEIRKLLDKAIKIKNKKYKRVVYLNSQISSSTVSNAIHFIETEYPGLDLSFVLVKSKTVEEDDIPNDDKLVVIRIG
jgi:hypothetical protein